MPRITKVQKVKVSQLKPKLRVAAYARVSMETEMLHHSIAAQVSYYSSLIQRNPEWTYVGVYADEGISGTSTKQRDEFNRMIADCEAHKIDMILAKSISRFARDTVDCLNTTRHLKTLGIPVYFEREKINTMTADGELLLTLLASFAQEESRSIAGNVRWAIRKRFEQGIPNGHKAPYGYEWDGEIFKIIPEQGEVVKEIYRRYLAGESAHGIAKDLAKRGIIAQQGRPFEESTVKEILSSRSYTGTMVLQKNFLTENKTRRRNQGELPMYLVEEMFEPLASEEDYETAQEIREKRAEEFSNNRNNLTAFSGKIKCGCCGQSLSRRTAKGYKKWICNNKERKKACDSRPIMESELIAATEQILGPDISAFTKEIQQVTIFGDKIEFTLQSGQVKTVTRQYDLSRSGNPFVKKVYCSCGRKCERDNSTRGTGLKVWRCPARHRIIKQAELVQASEEILGENYGGQVVEYVEKIILSDEKFTFEMKGGASIEWQRK